MVIGVLIILAIVYAIGFASVGIEANMKVHSVEETIEKKQKQEMEKVKKEKVVKLNNDPTNIYSSIPVVKETKSKAKIYERNYKCWDKWLARRERKLYISPNDLSTLYKKQFEGNFLHDMITQEQYEDLMRRYEALEERCLYDNISRFF